MKASTTRCIVKFGIEGMFVVEFLAEAVVLSVDPYMRAFEKSLEIGTTFIGSQVAK